MAGLPQRRKGRSSLHSTVHSATRRSLPALLACALLGSCIAREQGDFKRQTDDDVDRNPGIIDAGTNDEAGQLPDAAPHGIQSIDPAHGPFTGGQTTLIRGTGFKGNARVWFGDHEVPERDVVPIDPHRLQVTVPSGPAGAVDVTVQNGEDDSTRVIRSEGYAYDAFVVEPASGPTSGGTEVTLTGSGTDWNEQTEVSIDLVPCDVREVKSPTELVCVTPKGTPGSKSVRVDTPGGETIDVLDAFVYGNSDNGFRGGLSGDPLDTSLQVLVLDNFTGNAVAGASVILGPSLDDGELAESDAQGLAAFSGELGPKQTVTVAADCFQPITFVDVPVDAVTVYLDPVLSPACAEGGDPTLIGGVPGVGSGVSGELLWPSTTEFDRSGWTNVPAPASEDERLVAYVLRLASSPTSEFRLPSTISAVTPDSFGEAGFGFYVSAVPGNFSYYALAGIENRALDPPVFTAYAMGIASGVTTLPGSTTDEVFIQVDVPLDHALSLEMTGPEVTARGPDRARASLAVRVGDAGYALLPVGQKTQLLPVQQPFRFVGVPPLVGSLAGAEYVTTATAFTGEAEGVPRSAVGLFSTNTTSTSVVLDQFVEIPELTSPSTNTTWDGRTLMLDWAPGGQTPDLVVLTIQSGGGLVNWTVVAPCGSQTCSAKSIAVPSLADLSNVVGKKLGLVPGSVTIEVTAAHIRDFVYGSLRYRQLVARGWDASATDVHFVRL